MVVFPSSKINLGLNVINKRKDGYHNLETVFYPISINDILEIVPSSLQSSNDSETITFSTSGLKIDGDFNTNLCLKAYHLLKSKHPSLPPVQMHLHKSIPMGAGLGGGSADGAYTLLLLNDLFKLNMTQESLIDAALELGSDCPFFILHKPCFGTSRGELLKEIPLNLSNYTFVVVNPKIHISTAWAFQHIVPSKPKVSVKEIIQQPISTWKSNLVNDFEKPCMNQYPELASIKETMYKQGAIYASMTGSGSTIFGIFDSSQNPNFHFPSHYWIATIPQN